eukprot:3061963-Amphidinium_carterae.1
MWFHQQTAANSLCDTILCILLSDTHLGVAGNSALDSRALAISGDADLQGHFILVSPRHSLLAALYLPALPLPIASCSTVALRLFQAKRRQQEQEEENARLRTYLSKCKEDLDRALR